MLTPKNKYKTLSNVYIKRKIIRLLNVVQLSALLKTSSVQNLIVFYIFIFWKPNLPPEILASLTHHDAEPVFRVEGEEVALLVRVALARARGRVRGVRGAPQRVAALAEAADEAADLGGERKSGVNSSLECAYRNNIDFSKDTVNMRASM